jgi:opacity protein-like surface antigen
MFRKKIALLLVAATAVLASASAADAASGVTGRYWTGSGYCWDNTNNGMGNQILATSPVMDPAQTNSIVGGGQLVGFFVTLQRWNGYSWALDQVSSLRTQTTSYGFWSYDWYDHGTRTWGLGTARFQVKTSGYYRIRYDLFWFNDNGVVTGQDAALAFGMRDDRASSITTTGWSYVDYCRY